MKAKVIEQIKADILGRVAVREPSRMMAVGDDIAKDEMIEDHYMYKVKATFGANVTCKASDLIEAKRNIANLIIEELYGEFRGMIIEMRMHYRFNEMDKGDKAFDEIMEMMELDK